MHPAHDFISGVLEQIDQRVTDSQVGDHISGQGDGYALTPELEALYQRVVEAGQNWRDWQTEPDTVISYLYDEANNIYAGNYTCSFDQRPDRVYRAALEEFQAALIEAAPHVCRPEQENELAGLIEAAGGELGLMEEVIHNNSFGVQVFKYPQVIGCELSYRECFDDARNIEAPPPPPPPVHSDPLVLDLDGDGLETVGLGDRAAVVFDYDGDGRKQGTGWLGGDDGFLVFDRNQDGLINNGSELFSNYTAKYDGTGNCDSAFEALAQEDTNHDGVVDANDDNWSSLRVWRDKNQDGISQSCELYTLDELGITSFNLDGSAVDREVAGGKIVAEGSFVKDGQSSQMGEAVFDQDPFFGGSTQPIEVPPEIQGLPNMGASGALRELQEACVQSSELKNLMVRFQNAASREDQQALMGDVLFAWAKTSGMGRTLEGRAAGRYTVVNANFSGAELVAWNRKMHALEAFNGRYFYELPDPSDPLTPTHWTMTITQTNPAKVPIMTITYTDEQIQLVNDAYDSLMESVYLGLALQTRLASVFDLIDSAVDPVSLALSLDFSAVTQYFDQSLAANPAQGLPDLLDFSRGSASFFIGLGWTGFDQAKAFISSQPVTDELLALYQSLNISLFGQPGYYSTGSYKSDLIIGGTGNDTLVGSGGNDALFGEGGNDNLSGGAGYDFIRGGDGDDIIDGGDCSDELHGDAGNDTITGGGGDDYIHGGDGNDTLRGGVGNDTIWGGLGDDQIFGDEGDDIIHGEEGLDKIQGGSGDDLIMGGEGNDTLSGDDGHDRLLGEADNDYIMGGQGDDYLDGGDGDDHLSGDQGCTANGQSSLGHLR